MTFPFDPGIGRAATIPARLRGLTTSTSIARGWSPKGEGGGRGWIFPNIMLNVCLGQSPSAMSFRSRTSRSASQCSGTCVRGWMTADGIRRSTRTGCIIFMDYCMNGWDRGESRVGCGECGVEGGTLIGERVVHG